MPLARIPRRSSARRTPKFAPRRRRRAGGGRGGRRGAAAGAPRGAAGSAAPAPAPAPRRQRPPGPGCAPRAGYASLPLLRPSSHLQPCPPRGPSAEHPPTGRKTPLPCASPTSKSCGISLRARYSFASPALIPPPGPGAPAGRVGSPSPALGSARRCNAGASARLPRAEGGRREAAARLPCPLLGGSEREHVFPRRGARACAGCRGKFRGVPAVRRRAEAAGGCAWRRAAGRLPRQRADPLRRLRGEPRRQGLGATGAQGCWEPPAVTRSLPLARCSGVSGSETFHTLWAGKKPRTTISHEHLLSASHRKRSEMISGLAFCSRQGQLWRSDQVAQGFIQSHLAKPSKGGDCRAFLDNPCLSGLGMKKSFLLFSYHLPCLILFLAHHCEDPGSTFMMVSCPALESCYYVPLSCHKAEQVQLPLLIFKNKCFPSLNHLCGCPLNSESQNISSPTCK